MCSLMLIIESAGLLLLDTAMLMKRLIEPHFMLFAIWLLSIELMR